MMYDMSKDPQDEWIEVPPQNEKDPDIYGRFNKYDNKPVRFNLIQIEIYRYIKRLTYFNTI